MKIGSKKKVCSIKKELLAKSKEAMLSAVQIFNNPTMQFKSESFIVLAIISWTYLLHAYYKNNKIDYRYYKKVGKNKKFDKTSRGAYKYWELERCLNDNQSPIDKIAAKNLRFLIGIRHEIEHQMTSKIDNILSAKFQSCCLNYNQYLKSLFNADSIDKHLSFSIQFCSLDEDQISEIKNHEDLPRNILTYINVFEEEITEEDFNNPKYSYRVFFAPKIVNKKGQADKVVEFIRPDSPLAQNISKDFYLLKDSEKQKYLPKTIVNLIKEMGYTLFSIKKHTDLWQSQDAQNKSKNFGVKVEKSWFWYEN